MCNAIAQNAIGVGTILYERLYIFNNDSVIQSFLQQHQHLC